VKPERKIFLTAGGRNWGIRAAGELPRRARVDGRAESLRREIHRTGRSDVTGKGGKVFKP